jgi:hypothetical protein
MDGQTVGGWVDEYCGLSVFSDRHDTERTDTDPQVSAARQMGQ